MYRSALYVHFMTTSTVYDSDFITVSKKEGFSEQISKTDEADEANGSRKAVAEVCEKSKDKGNVQNSLKYSLKR